MSTRKILPLCDDDEPAAQTSLVVALAQTRPVTKAQQAFQRRVAKIEAKREELARWQA